MTNEDIVKALSAIDEQLKTIFNKLSEINATLHGETGLVTKVAKLEKAEEGSGKTLGYIGWIITTLIAIYVAVKHAT